MLDEKIWKWNMGPWLERSDLKLQLRYRLSEEDPTWRLLLVTMPHFESQWLDIGTSIINSILANLTLEKEQELALSDPFTYLIHECATPDALMEKLARRIILLFHADLLKQNTVFNPFLSPTSAQVSLSVADYNKYIMMFLVNKK